MRVTFVTAHIFAGCQADATELPAFAFVTSVMVQAVNVVAVQHRVAMQAVQSGNIPQHLISRRLFSQGQRLQPLRDRS